MKFPLPQAARHGAFRAVAVLALGTTLAAPPGWAQQQAPQPPQQETQTTPQQAPQPSPQEVAPNPTTGATQAAPDPAAPQETAPNPPPAPAEEQAQPEGQPQTAPTPDAAQEPAPPAQQDTPTETTTPAPPETPSEPQAPAASSAAPSAQAGAPQPNAPAAAPPSQTPATAKAADDKKQKVSPRHREEAEKLFLAGAKALDDKDSRAAMQDFARAAALDPNRKDYTAAYQIARGHFVTDLVQDADKARIMGQPEVARAKIRQAIELDPKNPIVTQHLDDLLHSDLADNDTSRATIQLAPPIVLEPEILKASFHQRSSLPEILRQVLHTYGIVAVVDESVRPRMGRLDVDNVTYEQAVNVVNLLANTFMVPLDPKRVLIAQDTRANREKFERTAMETVYLPGLEATELNDVANIARNLFDVRKAFAEPTKSTVTLNAPAARLTALNATLESLLTGRSQVNFSIRLFEVDKTRSRNVGIELPQQTTLFNVPSEVNSLLANNSSLVQQIISSGLANSGDTAAIALALIEAGLVSGSILNQPFRTFGGGVTLTGVTTSGGTANLSIASSDVRTIDEITARVRDQDAATVVSGTRYPIVTSIYSTPSSGLNIPGVTSAGLSSTLSSLGLGTSNLGATNSAVIPQVQYEDLGLTLKMTPRIQQQTHEIALKLELKLESLGGTTLDGNPILNNKQFTGFITLREGESAVMISSMSRSQSNSVAGIPGLSELPGFQSTTNSQKEFDTSDLIVLITPTLERRTHDEPQNHIVMLPPHS